MPFKIRNFCEMATVFQQYQGKGVMVRGQTLQQSLLGQDKGKWFQTEKGEI